MKTIKVTDDQAELLKRMLADTIKKHAIFNIETPGLPEHVFELLDLDKDVSMQINNQ
jgi:hypothetical protein